MISLPMPTNGPASSAIVHVALGLGRLASCFFRLPSSVSHLPCSLCAFALLPSRRPRNSLGSNRLGCELCCEPSATASKLDKIQIPPRARRLACLLSSRARVDINLMIQFDLTAGAKSSRAAFEQPSSGLRALVARLREFRARAREPRARIPCNWKHL